MRVILGLVLLIGATRVAQADGWWKGCDDNNYPGDGTQCGCDASTSADPASVGAGLGLAGLVAFGIGRKRRAR